jgi:hypothetical protein
MPRSSMRSSIGSCRPVRTCPAWARARQHGDQVTRGLRFSGGARCAGKWSLTRPTAAIPCNYWENREKFGGRFGTAVRIDHIRISRFWKEISHHLVHNRMGLK